MQRLSLVLLILSMFFIVSFVEAKEWSGSLEYGERLFSLDEPTDEGYNFLSAYIRYKDELAGKDYWSLRYDLQENIYQTKKAFDSTSHEIAGSLVHFLHKDLRQQIDFKVRKKEYPWAQEKSYWSIYPSLAWRWDLDAKSRLETEYNLQRQIYPDNNDKNNWTHTFVLGGQHKFSKKFTLRGRYRACIEKLDNDRLRHSILLGFNYKP